MGILELRDLGCYGGVIAYTTELLATEVLVLVLKPKEETSQDILQWVSLSGVLDKMMSRSFLASSPRSA